MTSSSSSSGFISKQAGEQQVVGGPEGGITSVEEFCPDGGQLDRSFLDDIQFNNNNNNNQNENSHHDSDS